MLRSNRQIIKPTCEEQTKSFHYNFGICTGYIVLRYLFLVYNGGGNFTLLYNYTDQMKQFDDSKFIVMEEHGDLLEIFSCTQENNWRVQINKFTL